MTTYLFTSYWLSIRTTDMVRFLFPFKTGQPLDPPIARQYCAFKCIKALHFSLIFAEMFRAIYISYLPTRDALLEHLPYNPLMISAALQFHFLRGDTFKALSVLTLFSIHIDYLICFKSDAYIAKILKQLMIDNGEQLFELNRSTLKRVQAKYYQPVQMAREVVQVTKTLWFSTDLQFNQDRLGVFPNISKQLRARLMLLTVFVDWFIGVFLIGLALILALFFIGFISLVYSDLSWSLLTIFTAYLFLYLYDIWNTVRMGLFLIHFAILLSYLTKTHLAELMITLRQIASGQSSQMAMFRYKFLELFYHEYRRLKYLAVYANKGTISPLLTVLFFTNISINILMLSHLIFSTLEVSEKTAIILFCLGQIILPLDACAALLTWSRSLYSAERTLFQMQLQLVCHLEDPFYKRALLTMTKIKLMTFYEFICTRKPFCFSLGQFGSITKKSLYEFFFAYTGMVMYVSKMVRKHQS